MEDTCIVCDKKLKRNQKKYCGNRCRCDDISKRAQERISPKERKAWAKIGRKNRFGRTMISKFGFKCRSRKECTLVNFLVREGISFVFEPPIPESQKMADIAILHDSRKRIIFVELDGLERGKKKAKYSKYYPKVREKMVKSWKEKISLYNRLVKEKKIDGYLIVTPHNYKKRIKGLVG